MIQRQSMAEIGFARADLINAQEIFGTPPAHVLGHGTNRTLRTDTQHIVPTEQSRPQALHVDLFFLFGQVFLLSISVLMELIKVTHLGPGMDRSDTKAVTQKAKSFAGAALLSHLGCMKLRDFKCLLLRPTVSRLLSHSKTHCYMRTSRSTFSAANLTPTTLSQQYDMCKIWHGRPHTVYSTNYPEDGLLY